MTETEQESQLLTKHPLLTDDVLSIIKKNYLDAIPESEYALLFFFPFVYWVMGGLTYFGFLDPVVCLVGVVLFSILEVILPLRYFGSTAKEKLDVIGSMKICKDSRYWKYLADKFPVLTNPSKAKDIWYVKNFVRSRALLEVQRFPRKVGFAGMIFCSICIYFS